MKMSASFISQAGEQCLKNPNNHAYVVENTIFYTYSYTCFIIAEMSHQVKRRSLNSRQSFYHIIHEYVMFIRTGQVAK